MLLSTRRSPPRVRHTLWAREHAVVRTPLERPVELGRERSLRHAAEVVVGLHVFFDGLATASATRQWSVRDVIDCSVAR